jgi:cystathionine beta-lyase
MDWRSKLLHADAPPQGFESLAPSTHRASTTVFPSLAETADSSWKRPYTYGLYGTPTAHDLAQRITSLTGGAHTFLLQSGQAILALINIALLKPGDHVLLPENIYGNNRDLALNFLPSLNIEASFYTPLTSLTENLRPNTRLVWFESPGSITMEVEDIPARIAEIRAFDPDNKIVTAIDDTYSAGILFRPFDHGIDIAAQALTKYAGGHSDVLLGSITLRPRDNAGAPRPDSRTWDSLYEALGNTHRLLGCNAPPDDCTLVLRGLQTLAVRLEALERSTLEVARFCEAHPAIATVLHPALPSCPGHKNFLRDFSASAGLFSLVFRESTTEKQTETFVNELKLFKLGYSWGGTTSVVMAYPWDPRITAQYGPRLVRLGIGLEHPQDLIADIQQAMKLANIA